MSAPAVSMPPEMFAQVFPFHLAVDRALRITQVGASLTRACPQLALGDPLAAHFRIRRPLTAPTFEALCREHKALFILDSLHSPLVLKGQLMARPEDGAAVLLCSPWVTSLEQLRSLDLSLADFALHDPTVDLMVLLQSQRTALDDASRLAGQLAERQSQLVEANRRLTGALEASAAAEAALRESELRYRTVVDSVKEVIFQTDPEGRWTFLSPAWTEITGFSVEESLGQPMQQVIHPDDLEGGRRVFHELLVALHGSRRHELRCRTRDGSYRWVEIYMRLVLGPGGVLLGASGTLNDVTEQRAAQRAQRESEAILRGFYDSTPFLMGVLELEGDDLVFAAVNQTVARRFGRSAEAMYGAPLSEWLQPDELRHWVRHCRECIRRGQPVSFEYERQFGERMHWRAATVGVVPREDEGRTRFAYIVLDVTERKQAEIALRTSNQRLSTLIGNMQAGVLVEDERRRIVLTNQTFCNLFAIPAPPEALVGADCSRSAEETMHLFAEPQRFLESVEQLLRRRQVVSAEELQMADGRTLERDYVPIFLDGAYAGHLWLYRNITERKQVEAALAQARDAALESSRLKSEFLAIVSHEIRTPLNAVIGMAELLQETPLNVEQTEFANTIEDSAQALLTVINDILDYSKIEAGRLILDDADFPLAALIGRTTRILRGRVREKSLALVTELCAGVPTMVRGDSGRLRQILLNLLGNAVKFTERGQVSVRVELLEENSSGVTLRFSITDTGIGIPEAARQRLFQPFTQADGSVTRRYGGTGLGLAISKSLAELMGGAIGCESTPGQGSTFWFTARLSVATQQAERQPAAAPAAPAGLPRSVRVLLAEDHPVNQQIAVRQLRKLGAIVEVAANGREALDLLARDGGQYQLVLMDCHMPVMDGYSAARAIRELERERGGRIPIIAMTASTLQSDRDSSIAAGMDDFLSKPVRQEALAATLSRWLPSDEPAPPIDESIMAELRSFEDDEPGVLDTLIGEYLEETARLLAELSAAAAAGDLAVLERRAHAIRGSSGNIGAARLAELCAQIEGAARGGILTATGPAAAAAEFARVRQALEAEQARARGQSAGTTAG